MIASSHARSALSVALRSASQRGPEFVGTVDLLIGLLTLDGVGRSLDLYALRNRPWTRGGRTTGPMTTVASAARPARTSWRC